jgi:hypothetical protein
MNESKATKSPAGFVCQIGKENVKNGAVHERARGAVVDGSSGTSYGTGFNMASLVLGFGILHNRLLSIIVTHQVFSGLRRCGLQPSLR